MIGRTNGGSGGGGISTNAAVLAVTTFVGASVTISNGSTSKTKDATKAHIIDADNDMALYIFSIGQSQFGTWSVSVTSDGITQTKTIVINSVEFYEITVRARVPDAYQEVEYLYSNRQGYIQTDRNFSDAYDSTARYVFKCKYMPTTLENNIGRVFGVDPAASTIYGRIFIYCTKSAGIEWYFYNEYSGSPYLSGDTANTLYNAVLSMQNNAYTLTKNGTSLRSASFSLASQLPPVNAPFSLYDFAGASSSGTTYRFPGRIYYASASINGINRFELIPCYRKSDSVAGMYDRVNKVFLTNRGTGSFTVGGDV